MNLDPMESTKSPSEYVKVHKVIFYTSERKRRLKPTFPILESLVLKQKQKLCLCKAQQETKKSTHLCLFCWLWDFNQLWTNK